MAGTLTVDETTGQFIYVPFMDFNGQDSFSFIATNANGSSNTATVSINVRSVNDAPIVQDTIVTTSEDSPITGQLVGSDKEEDSLTFSLVGQAGKGSVIVDSNGAFTYVPDANWSGTDTFTFSAHDGAISSNAATITINVSTVNDMPVANSQSISIEAGATVSGFLTAEDVESDTLDYEVSLSPSQGMVFVNSDGSFSYCQS